MERSFGAACCLLARREEGSTLADLCLAGRRCVELAMVAVLQERELGVLQPSALSISNGSTFNAIFLKLDLLIVFF